jgi:hypothetical protein
MILASVPVAIAVIPALRTLGAGRSAPLGPEPFKITGTITSGPGSGRTFDADVVLHAASPPPTTVAPPPTTVPPPATVAPTTTIPPTTTALATTTVPSTTVPPSTTTTTIDPATTLRNARDNAGFYSGAEAPGVTKFASFETQMARDFDFVDLNVGHSTWSEFSGSAWGNFVNTGGWQNRKNLTVCLTVPLRVDATGNRTKLSGGPALIRSELLATANGANDGRYNLLADRLIAAGHGDAILRLGHEGDITWYPWSWLNGNADAYINAFRRVAVVMKAKSPAFRIDYQGNGSPWNANYTVGGVSKPYGDHAYPGDASVDIIGVDIYNRQPWAATKANLDYTLALAIRHGKAMSVPEWGLWRDETGDDPTFIQRMFDWLSTTPQPSGPGRLAYHCYFWNHSQATFDAAPNAKVRYKQLFGS